MEDTVHYVTLYWSSPDNYDEYKDRDDCPIGRKSIRWVQDVLRLTSSDDYNTINDRILSKIYARCEDKDTQYVTKYIEIALQTESDDYFNVKLRPDNACDVIPSLRSCNNAIRVYIRDSQDEPDEESVPEKTPCEWEMPVEPPVKPSKKCGYVWQ